MEFYINLNKTMSMLLLVIFMQGSICWANDKLAGEESKLAPIVVKQEDSAPQIYLNYWQMMGKVRGTEQLFRSFLPGENVEFDVVLPQKLKKKHDEKELQQFVTSQEFKEHLKDIKDKKIQAKLLVYFLEIMNIEEGSLGSKELPLETRLKPEGMSIIKGSISFFNQAGSLVLLPERLAISTPSSELMGKELEFSCSMDVHFTATETRFMLLLNCASPTSGKEVSYMDYCVYSFPIRQEAGNYIARIRMKLSDDFEGCVGHWNYITYTSLF